MRNAIILSIELVILTFLLMLYFVFMPSYLDKGYLILVCGLTFLSLIVFCFRQKIDILKNNYFTITAMFILSFLIVHFQFYIDYILSLRSDLSLGYYLDYNIIPKAITISSIALVSFFIGSLIYCINPKLNIEPVKIRYYNFSFVFLRILVFVFFVFFVLVTPVEYFKGGYHEISNSGGISYLQYKINHFLLVSIWAYLIIYTIYISQNGIKYSLLKYLKNLKFFFLLFLGAYFILNILAGDRGPVIITSLILVAGYFVSQKKKINLKVALLAIVLVGTSLQFIGYFRLSDGNLSIFDRFNESLTAKINQNSVKENSILSTTTELATSVRAYHAAVMDQEYNDILYGSGNIGYVISTIPGLGIVIKSISNINFTGSAEYLTVLMGADHGMGTTVLADTYLNYGFYGSNFVFLIFGYFFARLDARSYNEFRDNSLINQILFLLFIGYSLTIGRSTFVFVLSDVLLVYALIKISQIIKR